MTKLKSINYQPSINIAQSALAEITEQQRTAQNAIFEAARQRERNEAEKRKDLKRIADNSEETVTSLKETNAILKENNQLLREKNDSLTEKLQAINDVIERLVSISKEMGEDQEELMKQALSLAVQLNVTEEENGKFNWKETFANASISTGMIGLQMFLHQHGLL